MNLWKNTFWNLLGLVIPTIVALPAMALMARLLGVERFGLFMLAFALLGYASIFDAGITRAVVRCVAINKGDRKNNIGLMGTAIWIVVVLSSTACVLIYAATPIIISWLNVTPSASADALPAFELAALCIPATLLGMTLFSYLEGAQQFAKLNAYKAITGSLVAALPALLLLLNNTLTTAITGLLIARLITLVLAYHSCLKDLGKRLFSFQRSMLSELLHFGSWVTLSNIISPVMAYFDRFILSNTIGAHRVAFYAAPSDAIARMAILPGAIAKTIFPLLSSGQHNPSTIASQAYIGLSIATIALAAPAFTFAPYLLETWLGSSYASESTEIFRILIFGFIFNAFSQIPFAKIQAHGQAKLTAQIHAAEVIPYLTLLTVLIYFFGMTGCAIAWSLRTLADYIALEFFSRKLPSSPSNGNPHT